MPLRTEPYRHQAETWPVSGRHILAQFDDETIVVYQAFRPSAGRFASTNGFFGEDFSYSRMSWIKPSFLWMMYRSGWVTKEAQEVTLAIRLRRPLFDSQLARAVPSSYDAAAYATEADWREAVKKSCVRLQWDPDHDPSGARLQRLAIQIGLRGDVLKAYGQSEPVEILDISPFVASQRELISNAGVKAISMPPERVYLPADGALAAHLGLSDGS